MNLESIIANPEYTNPYFMDGPLDERSTAFAGDRLELSYDVKFVAVQEEDFYLFRNRTARQPWRWEGKGRYEGTDSERNFATQEEAIADAEKQLAS